MKEDRETLLLIKGDQEVLKSLFNRYSREMYFYAMGLLNDHLIAEDAIQESFVYIWNHREQLNPTMRIGGYLRQSIRNYIFNYIRHRKIHDRHTENIILEQRFYHEEDPDVSEMLKKIRELIDSLPGNCRKIFLMAVIEGKGYAETAAELNISLNTVKTQVRIAYKKLRSAVGKGSDLFFLKGLFAICCYEYWH